MTDIFPMIILFSNKRYLFLCTNFLLPYTPLSISDRFKYPFKRPGRLQENRRTSPECEREIHSFTCFYREKCSRGSPVRRWSVIPSDSGSQAAIFCLLFTELKCIFYLYMSTAGRAGSTRFWGSLFPVFNKYQRKKETDDDSSITSIAQYVWRRI